MKTAAPALVALLLVSGCGGGKTASGQAADNLQAAAEQSDPAAAQVLDNAAEAVRDEGNASPDAANATVQAALSEAGNAQAATTSAGEKPSPAVQARPHRAGDPVPSEKSDTSRH